MRNIFSSSICPLKKCSLASVVDLMFKWTAAGARTSPGQMMGIERKDESRRQNGGSTPSTSSLDTSTSSMAIAENQTFCQKALDFIFWNTPLIRTG
jgi:hypothetical protein